MRRSLLPFLISFLILSRIFPLADASAQPYNVTSYSVVADAVWGITGCTLGSFGTGSNNQVSCPSAPFTSASVGKTIIVDTAGTPGTAPEIPAPFVDKIKTFLDSSDVVMMDNANGASINNMVTSITVDSSGGYDYAFNTAMHASNQKIACSGCSGGYLEGSPTVMTICSALGACKPTVDNAGSTTMSGACTVTAASQSALAGQPSQFSVILSGGGISSISSVSRTGFIISDSSTYQTTGAHAGFYPEPVVGCGLSSATLWISYVVVGESVTPATNTYANSAPAAPCTPQSNTGTTDASPNVGTGLKIDCSVSLGTVSFGTDNSANLATLVGTMNTQSTSANPRCIYFPNGNYMSKPLNTPAVGFGCFLGDEHLNSNIFIIPNSGGDMFSWNNSWSNNSLQQYGNTITFADPTNKNQAGASFRNMAIIGNRFSNVIQNGLVFYGNTQFADIDNVVIDFVRGYAIAAGLGETTEVGQVSDSRFENLRIEDDGDSSLITASPKVYPAMQLTSGNYTSGGTTYEGQSPSKIDLSNDRFYDEWGPSLVIDSASPAPSAASSIRLANFKFEQSGMSQQYQIDDSGVQHFVPGDELQLGDSVTGSVGVTQVSCVNIQMINPVTGFAAIRVGLNSSVIDCASEVVATKVSDGRGVQIDNCSSCTFQMAADATMDYDLTLGYSSSSNSCPAGGSSQSTPLVYNANGAESALTTCLDPTAVAAGYVQFPVREMLVPPAASNAASGALPDLIQGLTSASTATLTVPSFSSSPPTGNSGKYLIWTYLRSGLSGPVSDAWDSASDLASNLGPAYSSGQTYHARVCNQTVYAETLTAGTGDTLSGTTIVAPTTCIPFTISVTGSGPYAAQIVGG